MRRYVAEATTSEKLRNKRSAKSHESIRSAGFDATNLRSSAFICGLFSSDPIAINRFFFHILTFLPGTEILDYDDDRFF